MPEANPGLVATRGGRPEIVMLGESCQLQIRFLQQQCRARRGTASPDASAFEHHCRDPR